MAYTINIFFTLHTLLHKIFTLSRDIPPRALTKFLESLCLSVLGNSRSIAILFRQQPVQTPRLHNLVWPWMADIMSKGVYMTGIGYHDYIRNNSSICCQLCVFWYINTRYSCRCLARNIGHTVAPIRACLSCKTGYMSLFPKLVRVSGRPSQSHSGGV